jgi:hypothetical protein
MDVFRLGSQTIGLRGVLACLLAFRRVDHDLAKIEDSDSDSTRAQCRDEVRGGQIEGLVIVRVQQVKRHWIDAVDLTPRIVRLHIVEASQQSLLQMSFASGPVNMLVRYKLVELRSANRGEKKAKKNKILIKNQDDAPFCFRPKAYQNVYSGRHSIVFGLSISGPSRCFAKKTAAEAIPYTTK